MKEEWRDERQQTRFFEESGLLGAGVLAGGGIVSAQHQGHIHPPPRKVDEFLRLRGIGWTASMMGMMTLVRVLPPAEYDEIQRRIREGITEARSAMPGHKHD